MSALLKYDLFGDSDFTPCPGCGSKKRTRWMEQTIACGDCKSVETITANNARRAVVESLKPIGPVQY